MGDIASKPGAAHTAVIRDRALALLQRHGRYVGNVEVHGVLMRVTTLERANLIIEHVGPRFPETLPPAKEARLWLHSLEIRFKGQRVFAISFDTRRTRLRAYVPGAWEQCLLISPAAAEGIERLDHMGVKARTLTIAR